MHLSIWLLRCSLVSLLAIAVIAPETQATSCPDRKRSSNPDPELAALWKRLDTARKYREGFRARDRTIINKPYSTLITCYKFGGNTPTECNTCGLQPSVEFGQLVEAFRARIASGDACDEALWGMQESLNELFAGQLLIGNDLQFKALRARVESGTSYVDPVVRFGESETEYRVPIANAVEVIRHNPVWLRSGSIPALDGTSRPFQVINSTFPDPTGTSESSCEAVASEFSGETVANEYNQFIQIVYNAARAGVGRARRLHLESFLADNERTNPDDRKRKRDDAFAAAKGSAQSTYLLTALLVASQPPRRFHDNHGHELKNQLLAAQRVAEDVLTGFNPLAIEGDFVLPPEFRAFHFVEIARAAVAKAANSEAGVAADERMLDQDATALRGELLGLQTNYLSAMENITGILRANIAARQLGEAEARDALKQDAEINRLAYKGLLGARQQDIDRAVNEARRAVAQLQQIPQRIELEEKIARKSFEIEFDLGVKRTALRVMEILSDSVTVIATSLEQGVHLKPLKFGFGEATAAFELYALIQRGKLSDLETGKRVKELMLEGALLAISLETAQIDIKRAQAEIEQLWAELERLMRDYAAANENHLDAYYSNPAYRLLTDLDREESDNDFARALQKTYEAFQAVEYVWAERFQNPALGNDRDIVLGQGFERITRAESVFGVRSAGRQSPHLTDAIEALKDWDEKMRSAQANLSPAPECSGAPRVWSLKRDILKFDSGDDEYDQLRFSDFIAKHRVRGANVSKKDLEFEFPVQLGDDELLPGAPSTANFAKRPNIKLHSLGIDLIPAPGLPLITGSVANSVLVSVQLRNEAYVRTFRARWAPRGEFTAEGPDDSILVMNLPGARPGENSYASASVDATVNGQPFTTPDNGLRGFSPAVSRWLVRIGAAGGTNARLNLENLGDIRFHVRYTYGRPTLIFAQEPSPCGL